MHARGTQRGYSRDAPTEPSRRPRTPTPRINSMAPETPPAISSSPSSVITCVLITSYRAPAAAAPCHAPLRRPSCAGEHALQRKHFATVSCSPAVLHRSYRKTLREIAFDTSPSQAQQRWAERPAHPLLSRLDSVPYPSLIPPTPSSNDPLAQLRPSLLRLLECPGWPPSNRSAVFRLYRSGGYCTHQQAWRNVPAFIPSAAIAAIYAALTVYRIPVIAKIRREPAPTFKNEIPQGEAHAQYL